MKISFTENGMAVISEVNGDFDLPEGASVFGPRYALVDGKVVDQFAGKTDEDVVAEINAAEAAKTAELAAKTAQAAAASLTRLAFMDRFTMEELALVYTAAKSNIMVEVFMDKLKLAEFININDPQTIAGINALAASGLLTEERAQAILTA